MGKGSAFDDFWPVLLFGLSNFMGIIFLYRESLALSAGLAVLTIFFMVLRKSSVDAALFATGAVLLGAAEAVAVNFGGWSYSFSQLGAVPYWIFIVWGNTAIFSYRLGVFIKDFFSLKK